MRPNPVCVEWTDANGDPDPDVAAAQSYHKYKAVDYPEIELPQ